ncbi:LLM class flavin-dependent oxidoreductase [Nocardioides halotolerans]|uniref:LLM class flavin-dependent oxidoreductase n=1 Tax=Nocardioides halotolerans TaxID=433660 RepID=UPI0006866650|nr:LLM class flavin-dependent oxidoreductase [Nocardioides halotolerans]
MKTHQRGWRFEDTLHLWQAAEELGFHAAYLNDHLYGSSLETWSTLSALFVSTKRIRGGTMVTSNSFRHPALLAKATATVDVISGGRLVVGLGAGNEQHEYDAYGLRFPPPGERVARLEETCRILRQAWTEERVDLDGEFHTLRGAEFEPKPVRPGGPTLVLGVKGDRALGVAARHADEWNWNRGQARTEEFLERMDRLDALCARAGRDPDTLPRGVGFRRLKSLLDRGDEDWDDVVDVTRRSIRRGASQVVLMFDRPEDVEDEITFYSEKFIPAVMAGV